MFPAFKYPSQSDRFGGKLYARNTVCFVCLKTTSAENSSSDILSAPLPRQRVYAKCFCFMARAKGIKGPS
eukprot:272751-Heterocapsa_arctica.AAC.1